MIDLSALQVMEYSVLGALIVGGNACGDAYMRLDPSCFDHETTRAVFLTVREMYTARQPIDIITVLARLGEDYKPVLQSALDSACEADALAYYCDQLREQGRLRKLQQLGVYLQAAGSVDEARKAVEDMNALLVTGGKAKVTTWQDAVTDFIYRMNDERKPEYIRLGLPELDKMLFVKRGNLVLLGGYTSAGKTLLSLQIAATVAHTLRVGYFPLETDEDTLTDRMMSHLGRIPLRKIKKRELDAADLASLQQTGEASFKMQFEYVKIPGMTVQDIRAMAIARRYDAVFVDYLQLLEGKGATAYEKTTGISKDLHALAQDNKILVLALSQLSRVQTDKKGQAQPPTLSSFRESGQIEQDADVALLIYPEDPNNNKGRRVLKLAKNKEGERGAVMLDFDGATQSFAVAKQSFSEAMAELNKKLKSQKKTENELQIGFQELTEPDSQLPF